MICVTTLSCVSMMFETPSYRVMENPALQVNYLILNILIILIIT